MLSAFTARPIIELKARDRSKIETILAQSDQVFVGLNTGTLRIYRVNELHPPPAPTNGESHPPATDDSPSKTNNPTDNNHQQPHGSQKPTDLLREVEKFSTRAIEQLAIIKEASTLVSLSNYVVSLHDLQSYELIETLTRTKNASCFAVTSNIIKDPATGIPDIISRLAVAVKRRLLLWSWHASELSPDVTEVLLPETIRTLTWASATKIVCGMNGGYSLINVLDGEVVEIGSSGGFGGPGGAQGGRFGAVSTAGMGYMGLGGYIPKPLSARLSDGELLLAKDINTQFITDEGKPLDKPQIPWQVAPESVGYSYPYILALQAPTKGTLEVRNPDTLSLLQTISLPAAAQLHFPPPNLSLAHAGKGFHISSDRCVWKMGAADYDSQVQQLVDGGHYDEAISVLSMLEDALLKNKTESLRETKMLKAEVLFKQQKYRASLDLFNEDDVQAPPERVLRLYPPVIAGELSETEQPEEPDESDSDTTAAADNTAEAESAAAPDNAEADQSSLYKVGGGGFVSMFMGRGRVLSDAASVTSAKRDVTDSSDEAPSIKAKPKADKPLEGKDLTNAVLELNSYLAGTRARLQRVIDPSTGKLKPRQNKTAEEALRSFLSTAASDNTEEKELESQLRKTFSLVDTTLFRAYMFSRPTLAGSLFRIPNFCDPEVVNEKLLEHNRYNDLVDFFYGKGLHQEALALLKRFGMAEEPDEAAPAALHGPRRTVAYLQNLPPREIELVFEYAEWTLRADPDLAMEVFVADTENAETLPRDRVVAYLAGIDEALEERYLEHVISELNDLTPEFHNRLVELLIRRLKEEPRGEEWDGVMVRLIAFLRSSRQYSLSRAFGMVPRDDASFYQAQAVILFLMGQHKQALEIYVFKMKDYAKAEEYCNQVHMSQDHNPPDPESAGADGADEADPAPSIYHTLLSLYLTPHPPHTPNLPPALSLLSKHGSRLPASSTLSLIPDTLPVQDLESYFRGRVRSATSAVNASRVVAGLRATELISSQAKLLLGEAGTGTGGRGRRVVVTEERLCGVCHKRLGGSVVSVLPDNGVVHYGCVARGQRAGGWGRA
ncbi:related to PHO87 protein [Cephalotrichum gorgonifer]|uniref:Related to PHO87 protein n=1 Tax=Cephalotrichum gorgonifer TaxID=2041049 RepID=A0AAE8SY41_9PEZI|nr:related to PHO87 protein [Cephalotrichum gorgonifer]